MKRLVLTFVLAVLGLAAAAAPALAKEAAVELTSTPAGIGRDEPWTPEVFVFSGHDAVAGAEAGPPVLTIRKGGKEIDYVGTLVRTEGEARFYDVRVIFPEAGTWRYTVTDPVSGREYQFPPVAIEAPVAAAPVAEPSDPVPVAGGSDSFPLWPVTGGILGALALVAVAGAYVRRGPRNAARAAQ
jgi:hypothetical protein